MSAKRETRFSSREAPDTPEKLKDDARSPFERDRDRVLYSEYFRRLAGVTQVASAADGGIFHNRLTHSLKVAQVARRLGERLLRERADLVNVLNPDVVEAAALAHDLGHPPFGHVAEHRLSEIAESRGLEDGFEGNAQTFRIVVRLSLHRGENLGLDLTRATLNATLKYPWLRPAKGTPAAPLSDVEKKHYRKYSAYESDREMFEFVRAESAPDKPSLEAQVMDWADSITYSVHDLEDFKRAGLIPVEKIVRNEPYRQAFLDRWESQQPGSEAQKHFQSPKHIQPMLELLDYCISDTAEPGSQNDLELLESYRSFGITRYLGGLQVNAAGDTVEMQQPELDYQLKFLHQLVMDYVILSPRTAMQQAGQVRIIDNLTSFFHDALNDRRFDRLPTRFKQRAEKKGLDSTEIARMAIDIVASLSEAEAIAVYRRIMGQHAGSLLDPTH